MAKRKRKATTPPAYAPAEHLTKQSERDPNARYPDVYTEYGMGDITAIVPTEAPHRFKVESTGRGCLILEVWSDTLIRFRYTIGPAGRDFSYARAATAQPSPATIALKENKRSFTLVTGSLRVTLFKKDGAVRITDRTGKKILHKSPTGFYGRTTLHRGIDQVRMQLDTDKKETFYGMGDKAWTTDLQGSKWTNFNEDAFAFPYHRETLYRTVPFFYGLREGTAYGIFLDNTYRSHFDFNSRKDNLLTFWADGGELDYYFFYGPGLDEVAMQYHQLTGTPELPPLWALGFHQCRWSYYPESRVRELAKDFRKKQIPCDAIYLDIDYMDEYRCFTWNHTYFPNPENLISDLRDDGFHTVVMIDPGIKVDEQYDVYTSGMEKDVFCRRGSGELMVGPVWPEECVWPDYTRPDVREWWGPLYHELYNEQGVSGFWNDMNEPAVFQVNSLTFPDDVRHDFDGQPTDHKKAHNIYGMQMARASFEGLKALQPAKRPFLLGRANFSGGQRYAALWTGDNIASWEHLQIANRQCIRMAISGYSMVGTDIGGFVDQPTPEMLTRWLQLAVFHPLMRIHSMGNNADGAAGVDEEEVKKAEKENRQDQEPWVHGKPHTKYNRMAIELRYQLMPYLYTWFREHVRTGLPVLRNLFFEDQQDPQCRKFGDQFFYGKDLLVCPILEPDLKTLAVYLPKGQWYDFWTGALLTGGKKFRTKVTPDRIPLYVRAGTILPMAATVQHTGDLQHLDTLQLRVFCADSSSSMLYWDAGEGYGHEAGQYTERQYQLQRAEQKYHLQQHIKGDFNASFRWAKIKFIGLHAAPQRILVDGQPVEAIHFGKKAVTVTVPFNFQEIVVS